MEFPGYEREDGSFGVRNYVLVMSTVGCANGVVDAISRALPDVVPITHAHGCGYGPEDYGVGIRTLGGLVNNPNFGAVLFVGLGCENMTAEIMMMQVKDKPAESIVIQEVGGSAATTKKGIEIAKGFLEKLQAQERVPVPVSELVVGLECGGSDAFSGVTANPAVGAAADLFVGQNASVILSETTEMIGTAHILKQRGATPRLGERIERLVNDHEKHVRDSLGDLVGMVISPGNVEGGLSSITEKSLGCITKGGTTPIEEVIEYAGRPSKRGLIIMDTPGFDIESMSGMAAAGAQMIIFTTGRGSAAGFPGVPVIKVASNSAMFNKMVGDMDVNAGLIIDESKTIGEAGKDIFELAVEVAGGRQTCAEINRSVPFSILKQGPSF